MLHTAFSRLDHRPRVSHFESSPGKKRFFCPRCSTQWTAGWDHEDEIILCVDSLDDDPGSRPLIEIWVQDKAPWFDLSVALPTLPPGRERSKSGA